jgi:predicted dehydrogenase
MLKVGIIGYGNRISHVARMCRKFGVPMKIQGIADPRHSELKAKNDPELAETRFYGDADKMLENEKFDGIMIGTRCRLHTEMAVKASKANVPIFLEKPVAINFEQLKKLHRAFKKFKKPTVVSFPLRLSPLVITAKEMIKEGKIGKLECYNAFNDVTYGDCYFNMWYRDYDEMGGLWLQKATHDFDYLRYIIGSEMTRIAAINSQHVYGGRKKQYDLKCSACDETEECIESPYAMFYKRRLKD